MKTSKYLKKAFWLSLVVHATVFSVLFFSMRNAPTSMKKTIDLDMTINKLAEAPPPPEAEEPPEPVKAQELPKNALAPKSPGAPKAAAAPAAPQGPQTQSGDSVAVDAPENSGRAPFQGEGGYGDGDGGGGSSAITEYLKEQFTYISTIIFKRIKYPEEAQARGLQGKVLISFVILEDGNVKDIKVLNSSGSDMLDKNAVETVKASAPFPKPPASPRMTRNARY